MAKPFVPYVGPIVTRKHALQSGLIIYFSGKPCIHGHVERRHVSNGRCMECSREEANRRFRIERDTDAFRSRYDAIHSARRAASAERRKKAKLELEAKWPGRVIMMRKEVKASGLIFYFSGRLCPRGHDCNRTASDGACVKCASEKSARRYRTNPEKSRLATIKSYRKTNGARYIAWRKENPDRLRAYRLKRRGSEAKAEGCHTASDLARLRKLQRDKCAACLTPLKGRGHVDHIVPLSHGGTNWPSNLQWLCAPCNLSKSDRDSAAFMQEMGYLL